MIIDSTPTSHGPPSRMAAMRPSRPLRTCWGCVGLMRPDRLADGAASGAPLAAPSANPSGRISPTQPQHVLSGLDGRIAAILDGGPCEVGVESTIIGLTGTPCLLYTSPSPRDGLLS